MFRRAKLWLLKQRLHLQSGKYEAYLNQIQEQEPVSVADRIDIAQRLLHQPPFSRMQCWAEHQLLERRRAPDATAQQEVEAPVEHRRAPASDWRSTIPNSTAPSETHQPDDKHAKGSATTSSG